MGIKNQKLRENNKHNKKATKSVEKDGEADIKYM